MHYGHGNCARLPALSNYEDAKAKYENTRHIRGRGLDVKPLGEERRYDHYRITRNVSANQFTNKESASYVARCYQTDCVEFYENGDVTLRTGGWQSPTTSAFIGYTLRALGKLVSQSGKWYFVNRKGQSFLFNNVLQLKRDENNELVAKEMVQEYKYTVNRKAMNAIRKKYKNFLDYGINMLKVDNKISILDLEWAKFGMAKHDKLIPAYYWNRSNAQATMEKFFVLVDKAVETDDLETFYSLARILALNGGYYYYANDSYACDPKVFEVGFNEIIRYRYKDEVFNKEPIEVGTMFNDRNKKYFY